MIQNITPEEIITEIPVNACTSGVVNPRDASFHVRMASAVGDFSFIVPRERHRNIVGTKGGSAVFK